MGLIPQFALLVKKRESQFLYLHHSIQILEYRPFLRLLYFSNTANSISPEASGSISDYLKLPLPDNLNTNNNMEENDDDNNDNDDKDDDQDGDIREDKEVEDDNDDNNDDDGNNRVDKEEEEEE